MTAMTITETMTSTARCSRWRGSIIVPYWFACCVLMSTRGIQVRIHLSWENAES